MTYLNFKGSRNAAFAMYQRRELEEKQRALDIAHTVLGVAWDVRAVRAEMDRRLALAFALVDTADEVLA